MLDERETTEEAWNLIKARYESGNADRREALRREYKSYVQGPKRPISEDEAKLTEYCNALTLAGDISYDDEAHLRRLYNGLNSHFHQTRAVLRQLVDIKYEEVVTRLEAKEEQILSDRQIEQNLEKALKARVSSSSSNSRF